MLDQASPIDLFLLLGDPLVVQPFPKHLANDGNVSSVLYREEDGGACREQLPLNNSLFYEWCSSHIIKPPLTLFPKFVFGLVHHKLG